MKILHYLIILLFTISNFSHAQSSAYAPVSSFTIEAAQLQIEKKIWVYLPEVYSDSNKDYAVKYMHDAKNLFDAET